MARQAVSTAQLNKLAGLDGVLKEIEKRLRRDPAVGRKLKDAFLEAAEPIQRRARSNIKSTGLSPHGQELLSQMVVRGRGPAHHPNAFVGVYQYAVHSDSPLNPYWIEFGTAQRWTGKKGGPVRFTGQIIFHPFFRPAVTQEKSEVVKRLGAGLRSVLVDAK